MYGVSTSGMCVATILLAGMGQVKVIDIIFLSDYPLPQGDIDTKPNPVYGVSGPQESQDYHALDHTHKTSGDIDEIYDNVI